MKPGRLVLSGVVLGVLIVGCTAASHLKQLQPPAVPSSPSAGSGTIPVAPVFQRGIDIDAYTYPGQDVPAAAKADVAYIKGLHANAVSISFPFFITGSQASSVYATSATPTPAQLAVIIRAAVRAGLRVTVRPLLDEKAIHHCRCLWAPPHPRAWFTSYQDFLLPYAVAAQAAGASELVVGTEFTKFAHSPRWATLDQAVRSVFHGQIGCDSNWGVVNNFTGSCGPGVTEEVDAYPPMRGNLTLGWEIFGRLLHPGIVESEVGIDGVAGAYGQPYRHHWPSGVLDQQVQAQWFTAACNAAVKEHLGGIYFWPIAFGGQPGAQPTLADQGAWGGPGARAISRCFAAIQRSSK